MTLTKIVQSACFKTSMQKTWNSNITATWSSSLICNTACNGKCGIILIISSRPVWHEKHFGGVFVMLTDSTRGHLLIGRAAKLPNKAWPTFQDLEQYKFPDNSSNINKPKWFPAQVLSASGTPKSNYDHWTWPDEWHNRVRLLRKSRCSWRDFQLIILIILTSWPFYQRNSEKKN